MRLLKISALATAVWMAAGSTAFAEVQLTIQNGRVSLVAKDATIRQILAEWARIGQTKVVNVERLTGAPLTLQLTNVSEQEALDVLLRSVSGYLAAPRPTAVPTLSAFDRIIVMPASAAPRPAATPAPGAAAAPSFQPAPFQPQALPPEENGPGDDRPTLILPPPRGPVFSTFPVPQVVNPQQNGAPGAPYVQPQIVIPQADAPGQPPPAVSFPGGSQPSVPSGGTPRPGMVVPAPPQPGQQPINPAARPPESQ